jgi:hypothetical protein
MLPFSLRSRANRLCKASWRFGFIGFLASIGFSAACNVSKKGDGSSSTQPSRDDSSPFGSVDKVRAAANRASSSNNLKQIGIAMFNYASLNNDKLPTAAICDPQGKPLLSWRVTILPFIEEANLFEQFHLNEPWDSEHNKKLIPKMPKVYLLPQHGAQTDGITHYRVLVSVPSEAREHAALFDWTDPTIPIPPQPTFISRIADGTSNTILAVEAEDGVTWTKPDELVYSPKKPLPKFGYFWNGTCIVGMADGSVRGITKDVSETTLRAAISRAGGEVLDSDW